MPSKSGGDELQKVMSDLAKQGDSMGKVMIDDNNRPKGVAVTPPPAPAAAPPPPAPVRAAGSNNLDAIKQDAVAMLKPLVGALDISPEEKFEAMIEIIRASDDQEMIAQAFVTAKSIEDNDRRAQALIDIINEINYINKVKKS